MPIVLATALTGRNPRPELKGIKTQVLAEFPGLNVSRNPRPELKGIKTLSTAPDAVDETGRNPRPELKGIKTSITPIFAGLDM